MNKCVKLHFNHTGSGQIKTLHQPHSYLLNVSFRVSYWGQSLINEQKPQEIDFVIFQVSRNSLTETRFYIKHVNIKCLIFFIECRRMWKWFFNDMVIIVHYLFHAICEYICLIVTHSSSSGMYSEMAAILFEINWNWCRYVYIYAFNFLMFVQKYC